LRAAAKRDKALADRATLTEELSMTRIGRSAVRRSVTHGTLVRLCGLALACCGIGAPTGQAVATVGDAKEIFDILDENGDGAVTREEFTRMKTEIFYRALKDMDQEQRLAPSDINITPQAFADADLDGDGKISGAEFVQAPFTQFEAIDTNGDRKITLEEFRELLRQYRL
jgi:Ca2+-binding EF-hand superfamily protein